MSKLTLPANPTLKDLQTYVEHMMEERGFHETPAQRFLMLFEECGEFAKTVRKQAGLKLDPGAPPQDQAGEAADVLIVLLGLCNLLGIDLEQAFRDKEEINKQRVWK